MALTDFSFANLMDFWVWWGFLALLEYKGRTCHLTVHCMKKLSIFVSAEHTTFFLLLLVFHLQEQDHCFFRLGAVSQIFVISFFSYLSSSQKTPYMPIYEHMHVCTHACMYICTVIHIAVPHIETVAHFLWVLLPFSVLFLGVWVSWFNLAARNYVPDRCLPTPPLPPQWDGEEKGTKGETYGLR